MAKQVFCCALLVLISILTFAATASDAVEVVNKRSTKITVFAPPKCQPCPCPMIFCIREPCIQMCECPQQRCTRADCEVPPDCVCPPECKFLPGVVVDPESTTTIAPEEAYPLAYLTVEVWGKAYNVKGVDLERVTSIATVVVTSEACAKGEIKAKLYPNPESTMFEILCFVHGQRYGS